MGPLWRWALRDGRGLAGDGGVGSTRVSYLRGAGAVGTGAGDTAAAAARGELYPAAGGGEEGRSRGLKLCPPQVLTMFG